MLNSFSDFIAVAHRYKNFCDNPEMRHIYTKILSREDSLIKMINAIEYNITPVAICAKEVEAFIGSLSNSIVTLDRNLDEKRADKYRQAVGAMVALLLEPFGYQKIAGGNRPIPANYKGIYLFSGARYKKTGPATMQVVQKIEPI